MFVVVGIQKVMKHAVDVVNCGICVHDVHHHQWSVAKKKNHGIDAKDV